MHLKSEKIGKKYFSAETPENIVCVKWQYRNRENNKNWVETGFIPQVLADETKSWVDKNYLSKLSVKGDF